MKLIGIIILLLTLSDANAEVFKCKKNGKMIYKSTPCSTGEISVDFDNDKLKKELSKKQYHVTPPPSQSLKRSVDYTAKISKTNRLTEIDHEIRKLGYEIDDLQSEMDMETQRIRKDMELSASHRNSYRRNKLLASELRATTDKYNSRISLTRKKIDTLLQEKSKLERQTH